MDLQRRRAERRHRPDRSAVIPDLRPQARHRGRKLGRLCVRRQSSNKRAILFDQDSAPPGTKTINTPRTWGIGFTKCWATERLHPEVRMRARLRPASSGAFAMAHLETLFRDIEVRSSEIGIRKIGVSEIWSSLREGYEDFNAKPSFGFFLVVIYPLVATVPDPVRDRTKSAPPGLSNARGAHAARSRRLGRSVRDESASRARPRAHLAFSIRLRPLIRIRADCSAFRGDGAALCRMARDGAAHLYPASSVQSRRCHSRPSLPRSLRRAMAGR